MKLRYITAVYGVFAKDRDFCQGQYDTEEDAQAACEYYHVVDGHEYYYETAVNSPLPELPNRYNVGFGRLWRADGNYYVPPRQDKSPWVVDRLLELRPQYVVLRIRDSKTTSHMFFPGTEITAEIANIEAFGEIREWLLHYGYNEDSHDRDYSLLKRTENA